MEGSNADYQSVLPKKANEKDSSSSEDEQRDEEIRKREAEKASLNEQIDSLKAELEEAKRVDVDSLVADRVALVEKARVALDAEYAFAGKSDREVMVDSIKAVRGDSVDLTDRSDDYVQALFDTIAEDAKRSDSTEELREAVASIASPASAPSAYMEKLQNAWKTPLSISKEAK